MISAMHRQALARPAIKARLAPSSGRLTGRVRRFGAYSCQWARLQGRRDRCLHAGAGCGDMRARKNTRTRNRVRKRCFAQTNPAHNTHLYDAHIQQHNNNNAASNSDPSAALSGAFDKLAGAGADAVRWLLFGGQRAAADLSGDEEGTVAEKLVVCSEAQGSSTACV